MNRATTSGLIRAWACIVSLTFLLPAGAALVVAGAHEAGPAQGTALELVSEPEQVIAACPDIVSDCSG